MDIPGNNRDSLYIMWVFGFIVGSDYCGHGVRNTWFVHFFRATAVTISSPPNVAHSCCRVVGRELTWGCSIRKPTAIPLAFRPTPCSSSLSYIGLALWPTARITLPESRQKSSHVKTYLIVATENRPYSSGLRVVLLRGIKSWIMLAAAYKKKTSQKNLIKYYIYV